MGLNFEALPSPLSLLEWELIWNKPDWAKMRPDCVSACIDFNGRYVRNMERKMDRITDKNTVSKDALKTLV